MQTALFSITYEQYLLKHYPNHATIIAGSTSNFQEAKNFCSENFSLQAPLSIYKLTDKRFLITYGFYKDLYQAQQALKQLPKKVINQGAYIKSINSFIKAYVNYTKISNTNNFIYALNRDTMIPKNKNVTQESKIASMLNKQYGVPNITAHYEAPKSHKTLNKTKTKTGFSQSRKNENKNRLETKIKQELSKSKVKQSQVQQALKKRQNNKKDQLSTTILLEIADDILSEPKKEPQDDKIRQIMSPPKYDSAPHYLKQHKVKAKKSVIKNVSETFTSFFSQKAKPKSNKTFTKKEEKETSYIDQIKSLIGLEDQDPTHSEKTSKNQSPSKNFFKQIRTRAKVPLVYAPIEESSNLTLNPQIDLTFNDHTLHYEYLQLEGKSTASYAASDTHTLLYGYNLFSSFYLHGGLLFFDGSKYRIENNTKIPQKDNETNFLFGASYKKEKLFFNTDVQVELIAAPSEPRYILGNLEFNHPLASKKFFLLGGGKLQLIQDYYDAYILYGGIGLSF
jgi:hypothetical protein